MNQNQFSDYPICDTDIWINLCLGEIQEAFFKLHNKVNIADVVAGEIMRWRSNSNYRHITESFDHYRAEGKIVVINHEEHVPEINRLVMEAQLQSIGFSTDFKNDPPEVNKGEIASAIYAEHFGIPFIKSNDGSFRDGIGKREFPDLEVKDWNQTLRDVFGNDHKKRIEIYAKVERERAKMELNKKNYKEQKAIILNEKLKELATHFNKMRH